MLSHSQQAADHHEEEEEEPGCLVEAAYRVKPASDSLLRDGSEQWSQYQQ